MSTTIYNTFKMPAVSMEELFHKVSLLKKEVTNQQLTFLKNEINKKCLKLYDHSKIYPDTLVVFDKLSYESSYPKKAMAIILEELEYEQKVAKKNDKIDDFFFRASFYYHNNHIYVTTHQMPQREYHKAISKVFGKDAKEFDYWNNTDHPEHLTEKQWDQRDREWREVLGQNYRSTDCLEVNCRLTIPYDTFNLKPIKISKKILENPNRLKSLALSIVARRYKHIEDQQMLVIQLMSGSSEYDQEMKEEIANLESKINKTPSISEVLDSKFMVKKSGRKLPDDYHIVVFDF